MIEADKISIYPLKFYLPLSPLQI